MNNNNEAITISDSKFIFATNFSGDPKRDRFGSTARKANLIIHNTRLVDDLIREGFNVRQTKPKPGEDDFMPTYFISVRANYNAKYPPRIFLVSGDGVPVRLDEKTVGQIDNCYVRNVNAILNPYVNPNTGLKSLYIRTMYVEQDVENDPFASRYSRNARGFDPAECQGPEDDEQLPF